jgi:hypothetical protein
MDVFTVIKVKTYIRQKVEIIIPTTNQTDIISTTRPQKSTLKLARVEG